MYLHIPLTFSITAIGAAVLNIINLTGDDVQENALYLLIGSVSVAFISISLLLNTIQSPNTHEKIHREGSRATLIAAFITPILLFLDIGTITLLIILAIIMLAPVFYSFRIWLKQQTTK